MEIFLGLTPLFKIETWESTFRPQLEKLSCLHHFRLIYTEAEKKEDPPKVSIQFECLFSPKTSQRTKRFVAQQIKDLFAKEEDFHWEWADSAVQLDGPIPSDFPYERQ